MKITTNIKHTDWRNMMNNSKYLIKLKLNPNVIVEKIDDETVMYNKDTDSIIVLNITGSYIYDCIVNCINNGETVNINYLVDKLNGKFLLNKEEICECSSDISKILNGLTKEQVFYEYR